MSRTYEQLAPVISALDERIKTNLGAFPTDTAEGSIVSFADGADDIPLKSLVVNIDPVQDLSQGAPSPENICPISGWTGCEVSATGKNLWGGEKMANDMVDAVNDASKCSKGTDSDGAYVKLVAHSAIGKDLSGDLKFKPNTQYTFVVKGKRNNTNKQTLLKFKYTDGTTSEIILADTVVANTIYTNAFTSNPNKTIESVFGYYASGEFYLYYSDCGLFEGVLTADQFEPYNGTTLPINWQSEAGTVYGGKLDVLTGILTVYPYYASYNGETLTGRWISDRDVYVAGTTPTIGAQVVNIGAQGTEIQLSPHDVKTLLGQNNIWADTGDSAVEYRADTKLYIERLTEQDADMIADANITSGSYFMVGNTLYKATANIASGSAVIEGTNATRKSLSEALNEINS